MELRPSEQSRERTCLQGHCWRLNVPSLLVGEIAQMMEQSDVSVREAALDTL